ncbi:hypothetical protein ACHAXT_011570 [Thalassiosira profunda]
MDPDASSRASGDEGGGGGGRSHRDRHRDRDRSRGAVPRDVALPNSSRRAANARSRRGEGRNVGNSAHGDRPPQASKSSPRRGHNEKHESEWRQRDQGRSSDRDKPRHRDDRHRSDENRRRGPQSSRGADSESDADRAEDKPSYSQYLVKDDVNGGEGDDEDVAEDSGDEIVIDYASEEEEEKEEDLSEEVGGQSFEEDIEDANYNEPSIAASKKPSRSKQTVKDYRGSFDDSEMEELMRGDESANTREHAEIGHKQGDDRGNSPELNPEHQREKESEPKEYGADQAGGVVSAPRQRSADPPAAHEIQSGHRSSTPDNMDPHDDDATLLSRLDAPPSPAGPERNVERNPLKDKVGDAGAGSGAPGGSAYSNYVLDEEGRRQAQEIHGQNSALVEVEQKLGQVALRSSLRGQDPPERGRGHDPTQVGLNDPPDRSSHRSRGSRGGKTSRGGSRREKKGREKKSAKAPPPKSILKKRDAPIPITRFGKPVDHGSGHSDEGSITGSDGEDDGGDSDPEVTERKATQPANGCGDGGEAKDEPSVVTGKSGLRSGKYAALNVAAAQRNNDEDEDEDESDGEGSFSSRGHYFSESEADPGTEGSDAEEEEDYDDDDRAFKSIDSAKDSRFDRAHSHFLRTADLGLTQDTIFAEQFLDEPGAKPEPHYHHPSPHPPPGVQFHIDENWVSLDDGRGGHSPIAPQAVDALVAMGYRAACDPMMWTPTSKTRKFMTEKGLRFDDVPIPGPIDEGEGGPSDSNCLVWSGKFPHKYHGHEQPAIRSQGVVNMSPEDLVDLLMDSARVGEYNKSSLGRFDEVVLSDGTDLDSCPFSGQRKKKLTGVVMRGATIIDGTAVLDSETDDEQSDMEEEIIEEVFDDHGGKSVRTISTSASSRKERRDSRFVGVTKLVRTKNKPPLVRKVLEFFTLLHCRALTDDQGGDGYIIVGRGVIPASDAEKSGKGVMHSEILLNVHIVRRLRNSRSRRGKDGKGSRGRNVATSGRKASKGDLANRCLLINVTHLKSPMVPNMLAKKVGLSGALNFISDIRALTE